MALLQVENLRAYYRTEMYGVSRQVRAVDDVTITLEPNEIYGVAGESSCGKTTLIKVLSGTIKPPLRVEGGSVKYNFKYGDVDMSTVTEEELRKNIRWKEISYVMQGSMSVLNPVRRVIKTFEDIIATHEGIKDRALFRERIEDHVKKLGLPPDVLNSYPHELSGGMKQRVAIALATVFKPSLIIADEPTTALDVVVQRGVLQLLKEIQSVSQNTVLLVTHDMAVHANVANKVGIMYAGRLAEEGPTELIFKRPEHPYTQHLINSLPVIGDKTGKSSLEGTPPNLANPPEGCRFHPRCPKALPICRSEVPAMKDFGGGHRAACHLLQGGRQ
ncbi:ABC transporter ATP-binding protein [Leadbettera azotonutricia]|uniref:Oligopeptide transport ATP-binding protein AppF n=1 Tax=Leadbettera azotonutricia (strain ATCC BAA-888 / DSM 13862 / ZAS-9) TaxID=545695 RepID=F5YAF5_LEAAZ|nr:ABC transporter ATP-binding protein [Leadbettera azotonutricia]AEF80056.1 oligopeptide transport ATP-binding protein AppF [Leadbettera azotonutricia ZAS-9]